MLSARAALFRHVSRNRDQALALRDPAQRLPWRIRASIPRHDAEAAAPLWQEEQASPEAEMLHQRDAETIRRLVAELPQPFRETIVLREINDLSRARVAKAASISLLVLALRT